jgi:uncharacterized Zn-finger protein
VAKLDAKLIVLVVSRPFQCPTCDRTFINSSNLSDHLSVHTGTHKSYPCSRCTRTFSSRWNVKQHVAKAHTGEGEIGQKQAAPVLATTISPPVPAEEQKQPSPIDLLSSHLDEQKQQQNEAAHSLDLLPFESHHGDDDSDLLEPDLHHPSNSMASHSADLPSRYSNNGAAVWPLEDVLMQHEHE